MKSLLPVLGLCLASCAASSSTTSNVAPRYALGEASARPSLALEPEVAPTALDTIGSTGSPESLTPYYEQQDRRVKTGPPVWQPGRALMQGFIGVSEYDDVTRTDGSNQVQSDDGDLAELPLIGGGGQFKLGGERMDWGLELMFSMGWRANAEAFAVSGGGAVVAVDVDLLVIDLYGGPFVSTYLGDKVRVYAAAGPLMEWADYAQTNGALDVDGSGFGYGTYARTGLEIALGTGMLIGFGVRWSDSEVDLGDIGDLEIDGLQYVVTFSRY